MLNKLRNDGQPPGDAEALYELAAAALERGELDEAEVAMRRVLGCAPDHVGASRVLAAIAGHRGRSEDAIALWRRVVALSREDDGEALTQLGIALSLGGQHDEATRILAELAARRDHTSAAHADLGMALLASQRLEEALVAFQRACDLDPQSGQAYCGMGLVYQQLGRWWEAAEAFRWTEQLAPTSPVGPMNLAMVLQTLGEHRQARAALLRAAALAPDDDEIRQALAQTAPDEDGDEVTRPVPHEPGGASISGDLETFKLLDVLEFLRLQSKTGVLAVVSATGNGSVRLASGRLTGARVAGVPSLAEALIEAGVVAADEARGDDEELLARVWQDARVDQTRLGSVVLGQLMAALGCLLDWPAGAFAFHGLEVAEEPPLSFDIQELTLRLAALRDGARESARQS